MKNYPTCKELKVNYIKEEEVFKFLFFVPALYFRKKDVYLIIFTADIKLLVYVLCIICGYSQDPGMPVI